MSQDTLLVVSDRTDCSSRYASLADSHHYQHCNSHDRDGLARARAATALKLLIVEYSDSDPAGLASLLEQLTPLLQQSFPAILVCDHYQTATHLQALQAGFSDCLARPDDERLLLQLIKARLQRATHAASICSALQQQFSVVNQHAIVSVTDAAGAIIEVNDKFCEISGYAREELLGQNHRIIKSGQHAPSFFRYMWNTISNGRTWQGIFCNHNKQGERYWVRSTIAPVCDDLGRPIRYIAIRTDVSEQLRSRWDLEINEERLRYSQQFANIGTWDWNILSGELYWSEQIAPLFGHAAGTMETTYDNFLACIHPDDRALVVQSVNDCIEHGKEYNIEHRVLWPDGQIRWLSEKGDVVRDEDGKPLRMLGMVQDIHDRKTAQAALQESEARLKEAQSVGRIGHWTFDRENDVMEWSDETARIYGFEPGGTDPCYRQFISLVHPDDLELVELAEQLSHDTGVVKVDHRIIRPDGDIRWVHQEGRCFFNEEGTMQRMVGTVQDITGRKITEDKLSRFKTTLDQISDAVFMFDPDSLGIFYANEGAMNQTGYSIEQLLRMTPLDLDPHQPPSRFRQRLDILRDGGASNITFETAHRHQDGHRIAVEMSLQFVKPITGRARFVAIARNIEARKALEYKLAKQAQLLTVLHQATTELMSTSEFYEAARQMLQGLIEVTESQYGFTSEVLHRNSPEGDPRPYLRVHAIYDHKWNEEATLIYQQSIRAGLDFHHLDERLARVIATGQPAVENEIPKQASDDQETIVSYVALPLYYCDQLVGIFELANRPGGYDQDILDLLKPFASTYGVIIHFNRMLTQEAKFKSEVLQAKEIAERAREAAEQANQAKSLFLASMSHELRTPLNAIMGFSQLFATSPDLGENHKQNARQIMRAGKHLLELINDVLDLSKIEAGKMALSLEPVDLTTLIGECQTLIRPAVKEKHIELWVKTCEYQVMADHTRLKQVLLNLLSNAIKYNRNGGEVHLQCSPISSSRVQIAIRDSGMGIAEEQLEQLFEPFNRLGRENQTIEGTGIGLVVTRRMVEAMDGSIGVTSAPGKGSTFWIELPGEAVEQCPTMMEQETGPATTGEPPDQQPATQTAGQAQRILVAEDNPVNQFLLQQQIERCGHQAQIAGNGREALNIIKETPFALLLTDINMPILDGYELTSAIRNHPETRIREMPIIAITANAMKGEAERCIAAGMDDYLAKPIELGELQQMLERWIGRVLADAATADEATVGEPGPAAPAEASEETPTDDISRERLAQLLGDDPAIQQRLLGLYLDNSPQTLQRLQDGFAARDAKQIAASAHKLKSSSRAIGANTLGARLEALEKAGKASDWAQLETLRDGIAEALEQVLTQVRGMLAPPRDEPEAASSHGNAAPDIAEPPAPATGKSLLLIDDDAFILDQICAFLKPYPDFRVESRGDGASALTYLDHCEKLPELILCDLNMPGIDGITLLRMIAERSFTGGIILISGEDPRIVKSVTQLAKAHKLNILGSLQKPFTQKQLLEMLEKGLTTGDAPTRTIRQDPTLSFHELRQGLAGDSVLLYYQPKVAMDSGKLISLEALCRWRRADGSILPPSAFIPLAEQFSLINELTDQVFKSAVRQLAQWREQGRTDTVAVNFSLHSFERINLPEQLSLICQQHRIAPQQVILEVTETGVFKNLAVALEVLNRLRLKGFTLSIDDFGTGYSTMEQLQKLPFSELKLDRSYVGNAVSNEDSHAILESSIELARKLSLKVVAEGIETEQDWRLLRDLGSDMAQGYFIARPMDAEQLGNWLNTWTQTFNQLND